MVQHCRRYLLVALAVCLVLITASGVSTIAARSSAAGPSAEVESVSALADARESLAAGKYPEAESLARSLLASAEFESGPESIEVAEILDVIVEAMLESGKVRDPSLLDFAHRALAIKEERLGSGAPESIVTVFALVRALTYSGNYQDALTLCERLLVMQEGAGDTAEPELGRTIATLGWLKWQTGDSTGAIPYFERALAIKERTLGENHFEVGVLLTNFSLVYQNRAEYAKARELNERAVTVMEQAMGPEDPEVATGLTNLGNLLRRMGDYAAARRSFERALAIDEKAYGPNHPLVAQNKYNLGLLLGSMGLYDAALQLQEEALAIEEEEYGPDHLAVAGSLNGLAILYDQRGDREKARVLYERAMAIYEKSPRPRSQHATLLINYSKLLSESGDYDGARIQLERSLEIYESVVPPDHPVVARSTHELGVLFTMTGDLSAAREQFERTLEIREKSYGPNHPEVAMSLLRLADLERREGKTRAALDTTLRAESIAREQFRLVAQFLAESEALRYASARVSGVNLMLSAVERERDAEVIRRVWDELARSRALVLDEMLSRLRVVRGGTNAELTALEGRLVASRGRLANLTIRGPGRQGAQRHQEMLDEARAEKMAAERDLAEQSAAFRRELAERAVGLRDVVSALDEGSALVSFASFERFELPGPSPESADDLEEISERDSETTERRYLALILPASTAEPRVVALGAAADIDLLVGAWQDEFPLGTSSSPRQKATAQSYLATGTALRKAVWDPIAPHVAGARRVFIVPDGMLNLVNLATLPTENDRFLLESGPLVHYLSTERDLARGTDRAPGKGIVLVGGADFDESSFFAALSPRPQKAEAGAAGGTENVPVTAPTVPAAFRSQRSTCSDFESLSFQELPATNREVKEIAKLWNQASSRQSPGQSGPNTAAPLLGKAANEAAFKQHAPGKRVLHLATHGFFLGAECQSSLDSLRGIGGIAHVEEQPALVPGESPLILAGLALAGANHRAAAGSHEDDGILTAEEIATLDLSGVEWAVLSACDTGAGHIEAGEGVFGMRRAFQLAGAQTIIMSLRPVEDESTRRWMKALYEWRLLKGLSTAEAMRAASLQLLRQRRESGRSTHPFYWGGFVASGDWE